MRYAKCTTYLLVPTTALSSASAIDVHTHFCRANDCTWTIVKFDTRPPVLSLLSMLPILSDFESRANSRFSLFWKVIFLSFGTIR